MPKRVPVICSVPLEGITAKIVVPLDLTWSEANRIRNVLDAQITDPTEAAKVSAVDPDFFPEPAA